MSSEIGLKSRSLDWKKPRSTGGAPYRTLLNIVKDVVLSTACVLRFFEYNSTIKGICTIQYSDNNLENSAVGLYGYVARRCLAHQR